VGDTVGVVRRRIKRHHPHLEDFKSKRSAAAWTLPLYWRGSALTDSTALSELGVASTLTLQLSV
jgi:hypothetical protein